MDLIAQLASGPKKFSDLVGAPYEIEGQINLAISTGQIIRHVNGCVSYRLATPPPPDDPLPPDFTAHHPCVQCGEPVFDRRRLHCGRKCYILSRLKPRPPCQHCGKPVNRDRKYCSVACRHEGRVKHGKKRRHGRFVK